MLTDLRELRIEKQLAAGLGMTRRALSEAESLSDQSFADDLREAVVELERLHEAFMLRGRRYRHNSAAVRNC